MSEASDFQLPKSEDETVEARVGGFNLRSPQDVGGQVRTFVWYVYVLKSRQDGHLYVGSTSDLKRRVQEHNKGECTSTRHRGPLDLQAYIAVREEGTARSLEKYLKSGSGIATLRKRILSSDVSKVREN